ncbi:unnamed protein product [Cyprideis torosa]|uniref:Uncharacterized protein n=1 Tax=Cyprideis torosa TaxID=163714 RepID=A0A7R8W0R8_9CRUS|nr:unnamed protein product [Cyprideis torosa]CAG0879911.1 unnamed protein product [Cyprideis torosa]
MGTSIMKKCLRDQKQGLSAAQYARPLPSLTCRCTRSRTSAELLGKRAKETYSLASRCSSLPFGPTSTQQQRTPPFSSDPLKVQHLQQTSKSFCSSSSPISSGMFHGLNTLVCVKASFRNVPPATTGAKYPAPSRA